MVVLLALLASLFIASSDLPLGQKCLLICLLMLGGLIGAGWQSDRERKKAFEESATYDPSPNWDGGFASRQDLHEAGALSNDSGLTFGTWYPTQEVVTYNPKPGKMKPVLVFGGMGEGKTSGVMNPAALQWRGSLILIEATSETALIAAHHRMKYGPVFIVNPMGVFEKEFRGLTPARLNFFANYWLNPKDFRTFYIRSNQLAKAAVPDRQARDPFWDLMTQIFAEVGIIVEKHLNPDKMTITRLAEIFQIGLQKYCEDAVPRVKDPHVRMLLSSLLDNKDLKSVAEVIQNARSHLAPFLQPPIADAFSKAEICFGDCRKRVQTIIFVNPLEALGALDVPRRLTLDCCLAELQSSQFDGTVPVLVIVDELAQYGKMDGVARAMSGLRRFNSLMMLGVNDFGTLQHIYGKELADTFINNAGLTVFMSAKDAAGTEFLSRKLGEREVFTEGLSVNVAQGKGGVSLNRTHGKQRRRVMEPFEIAQMNPENLIAFMDGVTRPILIAKRPYYKTELAKIARSNPYAPVTKNG